MKLRRTNLIRLIRYYPPYIGAGIRLREISPDIRRFVVEMKLRWYNRNLYGGHFGGSLYAMCDPFFAIIVYAYLGDQYIVLDKSASIQFKKQGRGTVRAIFQLEDDVLQAIKEEVDRNGKTTRSFTAQVLDDQGMTIAEVEKEIYVRKLN
ncbi:MAG: DUF4442 domain-containing protein [Ignavibacteria bacterium]|nr:DUF4442 domain-containing protein [Ignavibacteria bacterium]